MTDNKDIDKLIELLQGYRRGEQLEGDLSGWHSLEDNELQILLTRAARGEFNPDEWRTVPQPKVIDLSCLVVTEKTPENQRVLCQFWDDDESFRYIGFLGKIDGLTKSYIAKNCGGYDHCRPATIVQAWQGGECPLPEGVKVRVTLRDGVECEDATDSSGLNWSHLGSGGDIIQYQVTGETLNGYVWPDEVGK